MNSLNFTQRRRVLLAGLLALPGTLLAALSLQPRQKAQKQRSASAGETITVRLHPHAVARAKRRPPLDR
jgi:hypothetical protein